MKLKQLFNKHRTGELVIKRRYSSRIKLFVVGLAVVLLIAASGAIYNYGLTAAGFEKFSRVPPAVAAARGNQARARREPGAARDAGARAAHPADGPGRLPGGLDRSLKESAKEINKLREELSFYRNIISPSNKVGGLQVERLNVERAGNPADNSYRYKLVLIQSLKHESTIYGRLRLQVNGAQDGKDATLVFPAPNERPHQQ
ncbi:MAG: hypothetical protein MZW92_51000 [Comamonadaceae bacterium]|nr:hypothetical protein [Comamonadaceae bacterium]